LQEIIDIVCSYEKVRSHLEKKPDDKKKIIKIIKEIKGDYKENVVGAVAKFIDKTFMKLYDGVNLDLPDGFDIKEFQKKYHLILCPNHQSHADYIALQYILYKHGKIPVYIAGGINMNIFPVGGLFRKSGAFFIRRKFDEDIYKITFQGYIYYLLKTDKVVEFFFEGGRTRTGKLLPPRYGLFSMLLDAHKKFDDKKPLMFIPVSLAHEMIPEESAHAKELSGKKKKKETTGQLLKVFKLMNKKLGTVHVKFGEGIVVDDYDDLKSKTQELAFECFRRVGKGMPVTPTSLLSMVLLDDPKGALTWKQILKKASQVCLYCHHMKIPLTKSLEADSFEAALKNSMDIFINNKKISLIKREKLNQVFYAINSDCRIHLLYHKNMILHHFIVPWVINTTWFNIFNGTIKTESDLMSYLKKKRTELKYEFYLPTIKEMLKETLDVIEYASGVKVHSLEEAFNMKPQELFNLAKKLSPFATALTYIFEANYIGALAVRYLNDEIFSQDRYLQVSKELFDLEIDHGRVVKYPESFSVPKMQTVLKLFIDRKVVEKTEVGYKVIDKDQADELSEKFVSDLHDQLALNLKVTK
jgi:glycerol-3-phosphate O-acyltransferase